MSNSRPPLSSRSAFLPEEIAQREFGTVFRGYDAAEVRTFLRQLSEQAAMYADEVADLQIQLEEYEERMKNPDVSEDMMTRVLGERTTQILQSARDAAAELRSQADAEVSELLRESHEAAARMRAEAEEVLTTRTRDAEAAAASLRSDALATAEATRSAANEDAQRIRAEVDEYAEVKRIDIENEIATRRARLEEELTLEHARARSQARDIIAMARQESQELVNRTRMRQEDLIESLVRKRKIALAQVDELRAGRERLLQAYRVVRSTLDDVTVNLEHVEEEARAVALAAGRRSAEASGINEQDLAESVEIEAIEHHDDVSANIINLTREPNDFGNDGYVAEDVQSMHAALTNSGYVIGENASADESATDSDVLDREVVVELDESEAEPSVPAVSQELRNGTIERAVAHLIGPMQQAIDDEKHALINRLFEEHIEHTDDAVLSPDDQSASYQHVVRQGIRDVVYDGANMAAQRSLSEAELTQADHLGSAVAREFANELTFRCREMLLPTIETLLDETEGEYGPARAVVAACVEGAYGAISGSALASALAEHLDTAFDAGVAIASSDVETFASQ